MNWKNISNILKVIMNRQEKPFGPICLNGILKKNPIMYDLLKIKLLQICCCSYLSSLSNA